MKNKLSKCIFLVMLMVNPEATDRLPNGYFVVTTPYLNRVGSWLYQLSKWIIK